MLTRIDKSSSRNIFIEILFVFSLNNIYILYIYVYIYIYVLYIYICIIHINKKHKTIIFDFQVSPRKIAFLDAMLYKGENNNIQTTYIANLQINKHSYRLNQNTEDLQRAAFHIVKP